MASQALRKFIGVKRWGNLFQALRDETAVPKKPPVETMTVIAAVALALTPIGITLVDDLRAPDAAPSILPTVAFGVCALLAFLLRNRLGVPFFSGHAWKRSMDLTHTGVALGCIPAVLVFFLSPTLLADRHDTLAQYIPSGQPEAAQQQVSLVGKTLLILAISAWVSITEEVIYRGFLVSAIRRWRVIAVQRHRDILAVFVSTVVFGAAHFPTWGPYAALALTGLGLGFVIGYIANGEKLFPVIVYHMLFDALSLFIATRG